MFIFLFEFELIFELNFGVLFITLLFIGDIIGFDLLFLNVLILLLFILNSLVLFILLLKLKFF